METPSFDELIKKAAEDAAKGTLLQEVPKDEPKEAIFEDVPLMYRDAKLSDSKHKLDSAKSYYLWSALPGTGKTHLAWAIYTEFRLKYPKLKPIFTTFGWLQLRLRATMNGSVEMEDNVVKDFMTRKLVILDDFGGLRPRTATDYSLDIIFEILNERYSWKRQTIITSNKNIGEIAESFDARIASRIAGMYEVLELDGEDRRIDNGE